MNNMTVFRMVRMMISLLSMAAISACGTIHAVQPWEKGNLAKQEMKFDADPLDARFLEHTYSSKEAASGGAGVGGGGCGCN